MPLSRVLVANRGEIAVRVIRACRELGLETVAVYSDADRSALHVAMADRAVRLGGAPAAESYLNIPAIIDAARATRADAVHPGYGFLSENASFAASCADAGIVFVGPDAGTIERMGSKIGARRLVGAHGVPVVPGETPADQTDGSLADAVRRVGLPVLIKPSAGGGGIGMRTVVDESGIGAAIQSARRDAVAAFGDGTLYVERLVTRPRHVEIQVFADRHGHTVHLFERECSLQRRHQKVIEESPSPALTPRLRQRMGEAAVAAARAANYVNAGTVEFLLDGTGDDAPFYFLEMNTRLQVEHPVTEMVTGRDLVHAQLAVAAGAPLPFTPSDLAQRGHAIECRIYAEDPAAGFIPQAGTLLRYREPAGPGVRVDAGVEEGGTIPVHYDPMLAKLIVHAETRSDAIARARAALRSYIVFGLRTNIGYLQSVLGHEEFAAGVVDTSWLERVTPTLVVESAPPEEAVAAAAANRPGTQSAPARDGTTPAIDPWEALANWRSVGS